LLARFQKYRLRDGNDRFCGIPAVRLFAENVAFWPKVRIPNTNLTKHWYRGDAELNQGLAKSVTAAFVHSLVAVFVGAKGLLLRQTRHPEGGH
jgi:hypothetical protein